MGHKNIKKAYLFRVHYYYIGFINFMLSDKTLIDFNSSSYLYGFEKNGNIILSYFEKE